MTMCLCTADCNQAALERKGLSCTYLAQHELERVFIVMITLLLHLAARKTRHDYITLQVNHVYIRRLEDALEVMCQQQQQAHLYEQISMTLVQATQ